ITVAGSLGILMLPSIPKIVYAVSTNTSIGALFVAGLLPGTVLTIMLCTVTWYLAKRRKYSFMQKATLAPTWRAFHQDNLGADARRHHHWWHLQRHLHRDGSGSHGGRLFVLHFGVRLQGY